MLWPSPRVLIRPNSFSNLFRRCFASSAISQVYSRATCGRQAFDSDVDRKAEATCGRITLQQVIRSVAPDQHNEACKLTFADFEQQWTKDSSMMDNHAVCSPVQ